MKLYIISVFLLASVHWSISATLDSMKLVHYYGPTIDKFYTYNLKTAPKFITKPEFSKSSPTVFYFHGFEGNMTSSQILLIINSYLTRADSNLVIVDWTELSNSNYILDILPNVWKIADALSDVLLNLLKNGLDIQKLHLVGFSVGSHIAGLLGRQIQEKSAKNFVIKRITALDPAFPLFYPEIFYKPVSKDDAKFVDIIHTDGGLYGTPVATGTIDFWPNGGYLPQPGCPLRTFQVMSDDDLCTHSRSYHFWAESIASKKVKTFEAANCSSWETFKLNWCERTSAPVHMGIDAPFNIGGNYFLETNDKAPFSKGAAGATYSPRTIFNFIPK